MDETRKHFRNGNMSVGRRTFAIHGGEYICSNCGHTEYTAHPFKASVTCPKCEETMYLYLESIGASKQEEVEISPYVPGPPSIVAEFMYAEAETKDPRSQMCLSREANIEGILYDILGYALNTGTTHIPKASVTKYAKKIDVEPKIAEEYVKTLDYMIFHQKQIRENDTIECNFKRELEAFIPNQIYFQVDLKVADYIVNHWTKPKEK